MKKNNAFKIKVYTLLVFLLSGCSFDAKVGSESSSDPTTNADFIITSGTQYIINENNPSQNIEITGQCPQAAVSVKILNTNYNCQNGNFNASINPSLISEGQHSITIESDNGIVTQIQVQKDTTKPSLVLAKTTSPTVYNTNVSMTLTLSESCQTLDASELTLTNASIQNLTQNGLVISFDVVAQGQGSVQVQAPAAICQDSSQNYNSISNSVSYVFDSVVNTPPSSFNDGSSNSSTSSTPTFTWVAASDVNSSIASYEIAIGSSAGGTNILNWTDVGNVTSKSFNSLTLVSGQTYYASVRAKDAIGNISNIVQGDGWSVASANNAPVANNDTIFISVGETYELNPLANDTDADGNSLTITAVGSAVKGTPSITSASTRITYTPQAQASGVDSFTYTISDGAGGNHTATVHIRIVGTYTWTGATSSTWSTLTNFCGSIKTDRSGCNNNASVAPTVADIIYFDGTCTSANCSPTMGGNVTVGGMILDSDYTGSVMFLSLNVGNGTTSLMAKFLGGSLDINNNLRISKQASDSKIEIKNCSLSVGGFPGDMRFLGSPIVNVSGVASINGGDGPTSISGGTLNILPTGDLNIGFFSGLGAALSVPTINISVGGKLRYGQDGDTPCVDTATTTINSLGTIFNNGEICGTGGI